jgi:4a-hydroxytetrahydrobiopterin dehydratase
MSELTERKCKPCEGDVAPLTAEQAEKMMPELHADWSLDADGKSIVRLFSFPAYGRTIAFTNVVAWVAITEGHHPEMTVNYGSCKVSYSTHSIGGLSDNDFICAAKIDRFFAAA